MVRVAFDATPLLGSRTGIGVAAAGWLRAVAQLPDVALTAYGLTVKGGRPLIPLVPPGVRVAERRLPAAALLRAWSHVDLPVAEWWTGPVDVVHGTNFVVPPTRRAARVVFVPDLTAVRFPELCTPTALRYPALVGRALASGAIVHTGSHFVAREIADHYGIPLAAVRVTPLAIDEPARSPCPPHRPPTGPPYILFLGTAEPRKDLPGLVAAFDQVAGHVPDVELRLVGPVGWGEAELAEAIAAAAHRDRIRRDGWLADTAAVLRGASVLCYPSRYEGFGFPPLEAMAAGVPVVATAAGAVPEVVGDAARLVPVGDRDGLAAALVEVLTDDAERRRLVAAGQARVRHFTWAAAAAALAAVYRDAART